jgi:hypothetical protein
VPRLSDCGTCGASATLEWITPIFDHSPGAEPGSVDALQVKIVCPTCGPLVQVVRDDDLPTECETKGPLVVPQRFPKQAAIGEQNVKTGSAI